ncbi:ABC transporter permease [Bacteroidales bacterium OttesenSCG-928-C19]|nr:ABC transporter permease [Bacteroidales bacterium OttesenSCG-928-C19]
MLSQLLKIIWANKKINFLIILELILVFIIIWFCCDYIYFNLKRYIEPTGFNIDNTYLIKVGLNENAEPVNIYSFESVENPSKKSVLFNLIKQYPDVESMSFSYMASPYSTSNQTQGFFIDSNNFTSFRKYITPEFLDVFKIGILHGNNFAWNDIISQNSVLISPESDFTITNIDYNKITKINSSKDNEYHVRAVTERIKYYEITDYMTFVFTPFSVDDVIDEDTEICIRTKSNAGKNFMENFSQYINENSMDDPYYLASIKSFKEIKKRYLTLTGLSSNFKSILAISIFLFANVFLIILGTFWFRTQSRRSELGLRMAIGSTKVDIHKIIISEALILLFIASIIALIICINVSMIGILNEMGIPIINRSWEKVNISQYFINYFFSFLTMAIIIIISVWKPASNASKIQPATVLKMDN